MKRFAGLAGEPDLNPRNLTVTGPLTHQLHNLERMQMSKKILFTGAVLAALVPAAAFAQSNPNGGAAAGAVTGAIVGGIAGDQQPKFREYVVQQDVPSYTYQQDLQVGTVLPSNGVTYYEVPAQYGVRGYRYTVINNTPVLVDPGSRRVVQVIR